MCPQAAQSSTKQSIKGGCSPSDPASFHHEQTCLRTNEYLKDHRTNIPSHEHILTRTALHLGSETLKLFLCIFSLPKKYNQTILSLPVLSYSSSTRSPRTHRTSDDDVVCGPLPSLRGPGLQEEKREEERREERSETREERSEQRGARSEKRQEKREARREKRDITTIKRLQEGPGSAHPEDGSAPSQVAV